MWNFVLSLVPKPHEWCCMSGRRIGLFGGTFDPIHVGHLVVASAASHGLQLDEVLFVVAHRPWQKIGSRSIAPSQLRFDMVSAAVADRSDFRASSVEIDRGGSSYTIDTVETILADEPDANVVLVVGSDVIDDLDTWHRHEELAELVTIGVIDRPGDAGAEAPVHFTVQRVQSPLVDLSSTMLRKRLAADLPVDYLVPKEALEVWHTWQAAQLDADLDSRRNPA